MERCVLCTKAVVYSIFPKSDGSDDFDWVPNGDGSWAEVYIMEADKPGSKRYRVVGLISETKEDVLNMAIEGGSKWKLLSSDFANLTHPTGESVGMYFVDAEATNKMGSEISKITAALGGNANDTAQSRPAPELPDPHSKMRRRSLADFPEVAANALIESGGVPAAVLALATFYQVDNSVKPLQAKSLESDSARSQFQKANAGSVESSSRSLAQAQEQEEKVEEVSSNRAGSVVEVEDVVELAEVTTGAGKADSTGRMSITMPYGEVKKQVHVRYDYETCGFIGLPEGQEWLDINKQFGVAIKGIPKVKVDGYVASIPAILVMLKKQLFANNAPESVGIFRIAPDGDDVACCRRDLDEGCFKITNSYASDVNVLANLIKVFFRSMPANLFNLVELDEMKMQRIIDEGKSGGGGALLAEVEKFAEPWCSMYLWLLDLMAEVVVNEAVNKMSAKNMAIVISPNLFGVETDNPMVAVSLAHKVAEFTQVSLVARLKSKFDYTAVAK
jgi:hypothetical protein